MLTAATDPQVAFEQFCHKHHDQGLPRKTAISCQLLLFLWLIYFDHPKDVGVNCPRLVQNRISTRALPVDAEKKRLLRMLAPEAGA